MKRIKVVFSALIMMCMLAVLSLSVCAASGKGGDGIAWNLTNGMLTLTGKKAMENHTPAGAGWGSWVNKNIASTTSWRYDSNDIYNVEVAKGVKTVGESAFANCRKMTSAKMADSVTKIGAWAFLACEDLKTVYIPSSVKSIGSMAFYQCDGLSDVYYAGSKSAWAKISIGSNNEDLKNATIHYGVSGIDSVVKKSAQTIKGTSKFSKTVGNKAFSLNAKAKTALSYVSSNPSVVTVNKKGMVTIKGAGTATIKITAAEGKKYQKAVKAVQISVAPKSTKLQSAKRTGSDSAVLKWKKVGNITGYLIQYSTSSSFGINSKTMLAGSSKTGTVLTELQAGKKYYVRIRAYKKVNGTNYFSKWSAKKVIKAK